MRCPLRPKIAKINFQKLSDMSHNNNTAPKLNKEHKHIVIQLLAAFEPVKEIVSHLKVHHGQMVSERLIYWYHENRVEEIEEERKRLNRQLLTIPVANKFKRLQIRNKLVTSLLQPTENGAAVCEGKHLVVNRILDSVFREMEPFERTGLDRNTNLGKIFIPNERSPEYEFVVNTAQKVAPQKRRELLQLLNSIDSDESADNKQRT